MMGPMMAGDWIKMRCSLDTDPAVMRVALMLKVPCTQVVGMLHKVWSWFNQHTADGNAPGVTEALLDSMVGLDGFARSLVEVGWLRITESGASVPKFDRHNGKAAKIRANTQARVERHRNSVTHEALHERYNCVTREEKRREEKTPSPTPPYSPPSPPSPVEQKQQQQAQQKKWSGIITIEDRRRLAEDWNANKPKKARPANCATDCRALADALYAIADEESLQPGDRDDPLAFLTRRTITYLRSREAAKYPTSLRNWLTKRKFLEDPAQWEHECHDDPRSRAAALIERMKRMSGEAHDRAGSG